MNARIFFNESFTYRLNVLAAAAIDSGEAAFGSMIGGSIREMRVLRIVDDHPGIGFAEIVRATRLDRSLVSRLIQSLLKQGLIERRSAPTTRAASSCTRPSSGGGSAPAPRRSPRPSRA